MSISLELRDGDLVLRDGDLAVVTGIDCLVQGLRIAVETPFGTDMFNTAYGFDVLGTLGSAAGPRTLRALIRLNLVRTLTRDTRVREITDVVFDEDAASRRWHALVTIETVDGEEGTVPVEGTVR
jgi:hypothetical protein